MTKTLLFFTTILTAGIIFPTMAFSQTPTPSSSTCSTIYGGGLVCQEARDFRIDKKVQNPQNGQFVDNIEQSQAMITPDRTMIYRIEVSNKTNRTLRNIGVTDTLPSFVQFVRSDASVKQDGQKITFTVNTLEAEKTTRVNIEAKVVPADRLPEGNGPFCAANEVEARLGFNDVGRDFVTFCITKDAQAPTTAMETNQPPAKTKGGIPLATPTQLVTKGGLSIHPEPQTTEIPKTGPEALALIALLPAGLAGLYLRRVPFASRFRKKVTNHVSKSEYVSF